MEGGILGPAKRPAHGRPWHASVELNRNRPAGSTGSGSSLRDEPQRAQDAPELDSRCEGSVALPYDSPQLCS